MPRIYFETFGCQMNILDTELVQSQLTSKGYLQSKTPENADIVLYNTCSVRDLSEHKVLSRLGIIQKRKERGEKVLVGVLGCMAERKNTDILKKYPFIDLLAGPSKLQEVPRLIEKVWSDQNASTQFHQTQIALSNFRERKGKLSDTRTMSDLEALDASRLTSAQQNSRQAYIRITRGCNKFCSFCVVPRTRGPEVHRDPVSIIDEAKRLVDQGVIEVTLLGQTINHYNYATEKHQTSFADLLFNLHEKVPGLKRLRFLTSYPRDFTDEALDVMASSSRICKYLHIPAQSGSNDVLKRMNRGYTKEIYLDLIERARTRMPNLSIVGDMIVGFPGETDADFEESIELLHTVRYKSVYVFKYSPRPRTIANKRDPDDISQEAKKERNQIMLKAQREISLKHHQAMVGQNLDVLVDSEAKINPNESNHLLQLGVPKLRLSSRTEGDHIVAFDGPKSLVGKIVSVKVTGATALTLTAKLNT